MTKLLILTQAIDENNPVLGFFVGWIREFTKHCESVTVICLEKGEYKLPENVKVFTLGKNKLKIENSKLKIASRLAYIWKFYNYIFQHRQSYDAVFVHMNQEYVLLAGICWRLMGKKVFLWRLHPIGDRLTDMACFLSNKIFTSSKRAYVAKYAKTTFIPVGVDLAKFKPASIPVESNKVLIFGRIAPIKKIEYIVRGLGALHKKRVAFEADIVGDPLVGDRGYYESLQQEIKRLKLSRKVKMLPGVSPEEAPELYKRYKLFVNLTPSGSLDKTIIEALSSGLKVVVSNTHFRGKLPENWVINDPEDAESLAHHMKMVLNDSHSRNTEAQNRISEFIEEHRLEKVIGRLVEEMRGNNVVKDA